MRKIIVLIAGLVIISFCKVAAQVPSISGFTPTSGPIGSAVIISGSNFDTTPTNNEVYFGTIKATVLSASASLLTATVPAGAAYDRISVVVNESVALSSIPYEVTFESDGTIDAASFSTSELFPTGEAPVVSITVDLDGDGLLDIVVSNSMDNDVSVLQNISTIGDINLDTKVDYPVGMNPGDMVSGDFDGDGKLDVAIANIDSDDISILRNTSSGSISFATKEDFAAGANPNSISVSDIDGDGKVDIAVVDFDNDVVSVLRNTSTGIGDINFATKVDFITEDKPRRVAVADIDLDSKPDLLVVNALGAMSIFLNTSTVGSVNFAAKQDYAYNGDGTNIVVTDLDDDSTIDFAISYIATPEMAGSVNRIEFFRNSSSPGSLSFTRTDVEEKANWMSLSDVNGDGKLELFFSELFNGFSILENQSSVGSIAFGSDVYIGANAFITSINSDDLDNDGEPDIVMTGFSLSDGSIIEVYRNLGSGASFSDFGIQVAARDAKGYEDFQSVKMAAPAVIDQLNKTVDITVDDCTDPTSLVVTFELSVGASASINGMGGPATQVSGVTANDFTNPLVYEITAEDGSHIQNWTVTVSANKFADNVTTNIDACESYEFDGVTYTDSGQYQGTFTNQDGCDSLVTLNLNILQPDIIYEVVETCEAYMFDGESRTTSGLYAGFFTNSFGCDSMVTLDLTVYDGVCWEETSWSNGTGPSETQNAVFLNSYATGASGSITAKDLFLKSGALLEVEDRFFMDIKGNIENNGTIEVFSGGSFLSYNGSSFNGNDMVIKRNTRYGDGKYSMVGTPVQQDLSIVGSNLGQHVYQYDETQPFNSGSQGLEKWVDASSEVLIPGRGYTQANQLEISFTGKPNVGTIVYSGTYTNDDGTHEGFNLVSNPYPAAIDVAAFLTANTNIAGAIYIWDDNGSDTQRGTDADYVVANGIGATNSTPAGGHTRYNSAVGSAQAFFIKLSSAANTNVTFSEGMRLTDKNLDGNFFRNESTPLVRINLRNDEGLFKQTVLAWKEDASSTETTRAYDAPVFDASADNLIYTLKADQFLAIQAQPITWDVVPLGLNIDVSGEYFIEMEGTEQVFLQDKLTGKIVDLTNESYSFSITDPGSIRDRFSITPTESAVILDVNILESKIYATGKNVHLYRTSDIETDVHIYDMNGRLRISQKMKRSGIINASELSPGLYIVSDGFTSAKIVLQ